MVITLNKLSLYIKCRVKGIREESYRRGSRTHIVPGREIDVGS